MKWSSVRSLPEKARFNFFARATVAQRLSAGSATFHNPRKRVAQRLAAVSARGLLPPGPPRWGLVALHKVLGMTPLEPRLPRPPHSFRPGAAPRSLANLGAVAHQTFLRDHRHLWEPNRHRIGVGSSRCRFHDLREKCCRMLSVAILAQLWTFESKTSDFRRWLP